ncbi:MAG: hypothetical protein B7X86_04910 [Sphingobacteriales bacterium 17-39-43]|uniref:DUF3078 domain-containing protein n=1 Tax=Daejeonella sp. TaxID=2805397 RepID=UPI000BCE30C5|nr:DUF3078 domain-containing protein [Daejeonella sp.]OYZ32182.1 MAG: hypothetical protein B7Y24_05730 [Sphingobacteriales bacterium 16-39-50]OYZ55247.1 MAG: hypothetical protein B7Y19_04710 [Sphingobacteriales bacterium 24-40-4]OZA25526.1 MAG: hypothetical protein B7X86_04910 [Sphingobacteriales bacterium 17-39-43]HQS04198.1 DUF3078 domain-containing protein [Daejeonella sp.]HQT22204.1 DUF3078 domain-containing protein [Daejeonella sp.]
MLFRFITIAFLIFGSASLAYSQNTSNETDTIILKGLKQYPRRNTLPVRRPVLFPETVVLNAAADLDLKVNYWRNLTSFGLNINQAAFSENWGAGGVNSLALGGQFSYKTDYTKEDKNFASELILQYGKLNNKGQLARKTVDRIFWDNKVALKLSKSWYFFGSINFESQFDMGYAFSKDAQGNEKRTLLSKFMAPGYLTESFGFEYKPVKHFFLRIGTGTARQTFVLDKDLYLTNPKNFGVVPGKTFRNELAFQLVSSYDKDVAKNLNLKGRYSMFANYEKLSSIDNRLDLTLTANVNRLINVSLAGIILYDDDTANQIQASQTMAFGLVYKFAN